MQCKCWDQSECVFDLVCHMCLFVFVIDIIIFCLTGTVLIYTSADEPVTAIARLKLKHCNSPSVSVGHYRLSGDKVCVLKLTCGLNLNYLVFFFFFSKISMFSICLVMQLLRNILA